MRSPPPSRPPRRRRLANIPNVRLALADALGRLERGEVEAEQARVLVDGYKALAEFIRETRGP